MKKKTMPLNGPWFIRPRLHNGPLLPGELKITPEDTASAENGYDWLQSDKPAGVHEILLNHGKIEDPRKTNDCAAIGWVGETDWIYYYTFTESMDAKNNRLVFESLDTWVDIFFNEKKIASSDNMYLPVTVEIPPVKKGDVLLLHFSAPQIMYDNIKVPPEWEGSVSTLNMIRKSKHDFTQFGGQNPYLALVGPCGKITLEGWNDARIDYAEIKAGTDGHIGKIDITIDVKGSADKFSVSVIDLSSNVEVATKSATIAETISINIPGIKLWNPRGYGEQNLYLVKVGLYIKDGEIDSCEKTVGFRSCSVDENLNTVINGQRVRMWGACLTPIDGFTHTWDQARFERLVDLALNANMNILRIWGGGFPFPNSLYELCDKKGIMVWQDFIHDYGMYPNSNSYLQIFLSEAGTMVKRLKHHPCIILWCGGNESFLGAEYLMPEKEFIGGDLYTKHYRLLCEKLDPDRYYHANSPFGGGCANDPSTGDTHSYGHDWYVPGLNCPVFPTENNRASTPCAATMEKMMGDGLWPEGFRDQWTFKNHPLMPDTWKKWMVPAVLHESGDLQNYFDAENAFQLIYKFGASVRDHIRTSVECCRRGKIAGDVKEPFISNGHMIWKLNDTWPSIYCGTIDYYLLPNMSYYALRNAYQPVIVSFEPGDRIRLWVVNDTISPVEAKLCVRVFDLEKETFTDQLEMDVCIDANSSSMVSDLKQFGQIRRTRLLTARLVEKTTNTVLDEKVQLLDIERRLPFLGTSLKIKPSLSGGWLVSAGHYCHCVCIRGKADNGEELTFTDNYFHLFPNCSREVFVLNKQMPVKIYAEDVYNQNR